ncbi:MAG: hypothetical protein AAF317_21170 [Pseudomonadota bacterium]
MKEARCPIWNTTARRGERDGAGTTFISDRGGGHFRMSGTVEELLKSRDDEVAAKLTTWIYQQNLAGVRWPYVDSAVYQRVRMAKNLPVLERLIGLVRRFRRSYPLVGQPGLSVSEPLYAASESTDWGELRALWVYAREKGYAGFSEALPPADIVDSGATQLVESKTIDQDIPVRTLRDFPRVWLTLEGHAWLESLDMMNPESDQGFVAMWFDASMDEIYSEGFSQAIEAVGYRPMRVDQGDFAGKIDDEVIAQIRRSRFMVADLTSGVHAGQVIPRGSVYYEAGFAEGLGIPVLYTRREGMEEAVHFDLRQHNFIVWTDVADLRERLIRRISAVLGDGQRRMAGSSSGT